MNEKKAFLSILLGGILLAGGAGFAIYMKFGEIEELESEIATLHTNIDEARKTIEGTPALEQEVIVLRELSAVIAEILPDDEDVNNLIRTFAEYAGLSGVSTTSYKPKPNIARGRGRSAFDRVAYTLTLEGDVFQFLDLLHRTETHSRFIAVPEFKLSAASRNQIEEDGAARHKITLDVETYKYERGASALQEVEIEGYERKRDILEGEITRRRKALTLASYNYRGPRGRRDPWIDPRVSATDLVGENALTVQEQQDLVNRFVAELDQIRELWSKVQSAGNVLEALVARKDLDKAVANLQGELRRTEDEGAISYVPLKKQLMINVYGPLDSLLVAFEEQTQGPTREELTQLAEGMRRHIDSGEYSMALDAYGTLKPKLDLVEGDPVRMKLAADLDAIAWEARTLLDFEGIELDIRGLAIIEGRPPAIIINGRALGPGEPVSEDIDEFEVLDIRPDEIDFYFRGVVLTRSF